MADIELVVKIPERLWTKQLTVDNYIEVVNAVANGTPLPKGHGRLGDLDELEKDIINGIRSGNYEEGYEQYGHINNMDDCVECVKFAPTIIEADKTESEDKE